MILFINLTLSLNITIFDNRIFLKNISKIVLCNKGSWTCKDKLLLILWPINNETVCIHSVPVNGIIEELANDITTAALLNHVSE